jgi:hypothetical protein
MRTAHWALLVGALALGDATEAETAPSERRIPPA